MLSLRNRGGFSVGLALGDGENSERDPYILLASFVCIYHPVSTGVRTWRVTIPACFSFSSKSQFWKVSLKKKLPPTFKSLFGRYYSTLAVLEVYVAVLKLFIQ